MRLIGLHASFTTVSDSSLGNSQEWSSSRALADFLLVRSRIEGGGDSSSAAVRSANLTEEGRDFSSALQALSPQIQRTLCRGLSDSDLATLSSLEKENDRQLFAEALFEMAKRTLVEGNTATALAIFSWIRERGPAFGLESGILRRANQELGVISGTTSFARRFEFLGRNLVRDAVDPTTVLAMAAGSFVFSTVRFGALMLLGASSSANPFTCGLGARFLASAAALAPEFATFWGTERLLRQATHPERQRWDGESLRREGLSLALTLGLFKIGGFASRSFVERWHGISPLTGPALRSPASVSLMQIFTEQVGLLAGLGLARYLEPRFDLATVSHSEHPCLDVVANLVQLQVGSRLAGRLLGSSFTAQSLALETQLRAKTFRPYFSGNPSNDILFPQSFMATVSEGPGLPVPAATTGESLGSPILKMSSHLPEVRADLSRVEDRPSEVPAGEEIRLEAVEGERARELQRQLEPLLRGLRASVDDAALFKLFQQLRLSPELLSDYIVFSPESYVRRYVVREGRGQDSFEALVLSWEDGQGTEPHDHGVSSGLDQIIVGEATETRFELRDDGSLRTLPAQVLRQGAISKISRGNIHLVANRQGEGRRLVSFHVYRPIMSGIRKFSASQIVAETED